MNTHSLTKLSSLSLIVLMVGSAAAQFDSGSTGADGALDIVSNTTLPVQEDGVHNYTTINVNPNVTLSFSPNSLNTPVVFLAQGDVTVSGTINLNGANGLTTNAATAGLPGSEAQPGPGGFPGGIGGPSNPGVVTRGTSGGGPGGGAAADTDTTPNGRGAAGNGGSHFTPGQVGSGNPNPAAPTYGDLRLLTLTGGSGGAGGNSFVTSSGTSDGAGGGGGGGGILIASSGTITVNGTITARGGNGQGAANFNGGGSEGAGAGAGGTIRLMADAIGGSGFLRAQVQTTGVDGGEGRIVVEALGYFGNLEQNSTPAAIALTSPTIPMLDPLDIPTVRISAINGTMVPEPPSGTTTMPDVTIPDTDSPPFDVDFVTTNVPDGAVVNIRTLTEGGDTLLGTSGPVTGGTATATISPEVGTGVIYATVDFNP